MTMTKSTPNPCCHLVLSMNATPYKRKLKALDKPAESGLFLNYRPPVSLHGSTTPLDRTEPCTSSVALTSDVSATHNPLSRIQRRGGAEYQTARRQRAACDFESDPHGGQVKALRTLVDARQKASIVLMTSTYHNQFHRDFSPESVNRPKHFTRV